MLSTELKLNILSDAAKYDVSCSSSGGNRKNINKGLGNSSSMGICHSYTEDGRCVSLLKILLTNYCIYDCAYCITRKSNDIKRTAFSIKEVVDLTIGFYRRNFIEGLFLSSGIFKNSDYTMERLIRVAKELRTTHHFNGYIHLKTIPGASAELIKEAGLYADRLSINLELPTEKSLVSLAPEKNYKDLMTPMNIVRDTIKEYQGNGNFKKTPAYVTAGQTTQIIIGATSETDLQILNVAESLYKEKELKRVYYSGFVSVSNDKRLVSTVTAPLIREHRLYQADWLIRYYSFTSNQLLNHSKTNLEADIDPKLSYALNNLDLFPIEVNTASMKDLLKIPGIGLKTAEKIIKSRNNGSITLENLLKMGVIFSKAKYFLIASGKRAIHKEFQKEEIKSRILSIGGKGNSGIFQSQLTMFNV